MKITLDALTFLGGCLFFAFRGAIGKLLLTLLVKLAKIVFRFTAAEAELYAQQKRLTVTVKQSAKPPAR